MLFFLGTVLFVTTFGINLLGDLRHRPHEEEPRGLDVKRVIESRRWRGRFGDAALVISTGAATLLVLLILAILVDRRHPRRLGRASAGGS